MTHEQDAPAGAQAPDREQERKNGESMPDLATDGWLVVEESGVVGGVELLEEVTSPRRAAGDEAGPELARELDELRAELAAARTAESTARERHLRALADYDNLRKRSERERGENQRLALAQVVREVLPVVDNLQAALSAPTTTEGAAEQFREGVELIARQLTEVLSRFGIVEVPGEGSPFDPAHHEAVAKAESSDRPHNTVAKVLRRGYLLNERLLRPAMVQVAVRPEPTVGNDQEGETLPDEVED